MQDEDKKNKTNRFKVDKHNALSTTDIVLYMVGDIIMGKAHTRSVVLQYYVHIFVK